MHRIQPTTSLKPVWVSQYDFDQFGYHNFEITVQELVVESWSYGPSRRGVGNMCKLKLHFLIYTFLTLQLQTDAFTSRDKCNRLPTVTAL